MILVGFSTSNSDSVLRPLSRTTYPIHRLRMLTLLVVKERVSLLILDKVMCVGSEGYVSAKEERQSQWNGGAEKERRYDKSKDPLEAENVKSELLCTQGLVCVS